MGKAFGPFNNRGPVRVTSIPTAITPAAPVDVPIGWIQIISVGGGGLVVKDQGGTSRTYAASTIVAGATLYGPFTEITSMTCSEILYGDGAAPIYPPASTSSAAVTNVASIAAMKALASASNGQQFQCAADGSNWRYVSTSVLADDGQFLVAAATGIGSGAFLRTDRVIDITAAVTFATADAAVLYTVPAGFRLQPGSAFQNVTTSWTGGSSSAIGASSSGGGMVTKGDLLGGSGGDVAAGLLSTGTFAKGTIGTDVGKPVAILVGADTILFDRITSVFTAGAGTDHFPMTVLLAPAA